MWCESHGQTLWPLRQNEESRLYGIHRWASVKWQQETKRGSWKEEHDNSDMIVADQLCKKCEYYRELPELNLVHVDDEDP